MSLSKAPTSRRPPAILLLVLVAITASACTVGPDYEPPQPAMPETFVSGNLSPFTAAESEGYGEVPTVDETLAWWSALGDPQLVRLVERGMTGNLDIDILSARLREARSHRRARGARLVPALSSTTSGGRSRASALGPGPLAGLSEAGLASLENALYSTTFDVAWELDLFGRARRGIEASQARLEASEAARRGALLAVASEIAITYVEWTGVSSRLEIAQRNLTLQEATVQTIEARVEAGIASPLDLDRASAQRSTTAARVPPLRAQLAAAAFGLALLVGESPAAVEQLLTERSSVPKPPTIVPAGAPSKLLRRRLDLVRAERELHAANADVAMAVADRFPRLTFGGSRGFESASLSDLLRSAARIWSYGPRVELPLFRGGQLDAAVEAARARFDAARAVYERTLLGALAEVETALVALQAGEELVAILDEASKASRRATQSASTLYEEGLTNYLDLLDAQRSQTQIDDALASARVRRATAAIDLYRSLGGGWSALETLSAPAHASSR